MPICQTKNISKDQLIDAKRERMVCKFFILLHTCSCLTSFVLRFARLFRPNHKNYIKEKSAEKLRSVIELFWHEAVPFFLSPSSSHLPLSVLPNYSPLVHGFWFTMRIVFHTNNNSHVDEDLNVLLKVD